METGKQVTLAMTPEEFNMLQFVLDSDDYDLMDGWQWVHENDKSAWDAKLAALRTLKNKVLGRK